MYASPGTLSFFTSSVEQFSAPNEAGHYNDTSITDDLVRDVYMAFVERSRSEESDEYLRSLSSGMHASVLPCLRINDTPLQESV